MAGPHVVHVINRLERNGGAETSLAQVLPHLQRAGIRNTVLTLRPHHRGSRVAELRAAGVEVVELEAPSLRQALVPVRRALAALGPDLVHATLFDATVTSLPAARTLGVPAVCSIVNAMHSPEAAVREKRGWVRLGLRAIDAVLLRTCAHQVHAITGFAAESAMEQLGLSRQRLVVIPRGRDRAVLGEPGEERRARVRRALGMGLDTELILTVGRQEPQKAQHLLVHAFTRLAVHRPRATLLIAGRDGSNSSRIRAAIHESGAADRIHLLGARDDVPDLLAAADVFAFPSLSEGLGGSVLEAMALRVPIVSSDLPPIAEVTAGTATLVPAGSVELLNGGLAQVLGDPGAASCRAQQAYDRFEQEYRIERVAARTAEWYRRVLAAHPGR
ncbi:MAG: glycosyltransferase [Motilibacteraceae bacterium]